MHPYSYIPTNNHAIATSSIHFHGRQQPPPTAVSGDISGTMKVSGILLKWVNCAKGWRPRWFVLQDGVLSYYKIQDPNNNKIVITKETDKGCRLIDSQLSHNHRHVNPHHLHRKPLGELHLKVSSIHESRSDDRRFSIFTGTKKLHLKAKTQEDQSEWLEALQAVKRMFPRMSNSELMNPVRVSTEKLRERLKEEGVNEAVIQETEKIMRSEFSEMQDQLVLLRKKIYNLRERFRGKPQNNLRALHQDGMHKCIQAIEHVTNYQYAFVHTI